jgi:hypothetical protein
MGDTQFIGFPLHILFVIRLMSDNYNSRVTTIKIPG